MAFPFICLTCNTKTISPNEEDRDAALIQCQCGEAAWRLRCNCTGYIADGQCVKCGTHRD